jgi:glycosyltransferase involved in cell wall biosynthesis
VSERLGPESLRIVFVIGTLDRGGTEGQVAKLASTLSTRGHRVTVVCLTEAGAHGEVVRAAGVDVVELGLWTVWALPERFLRIRAMIRARRPDVVHCFLFWGNLIGVLVARAAIGRGVVLSSERSLQEATGARRVFSPWRWVSRRWSDAIVCNSYAVRDDLVRTAPTTRRKVFVIRNGVMFPDIVPYPPADVPTLILAIANLIAYKGLDVLLAAFALVLERPGEHAARLQLAGVGPEEGRLRAQAAELGLDGAVDFLGSVANIETLLAGCRFTVLPSYSEGMPNAVLESLAAGRAVIGTDVGGTAEILTAGGGILVPPGDPRRLADAIRELLMDPARARSLGEKGREVVRDGFSMDQMVDETLSLYTRLLAGRLRRRRRSESHPPSPERGVD